MPRTLRSMTPSLSSPAQHTKMTNAEIARAMVAKKDLLEGGWDRRERPKHTHRGKRKKEKSPHAASGNARNFTREKE